VSDIRAAEEGRLPRCMVSLPDLERGNVAVTFATLFVGSDRYDADGLPIYREPPEDWATRQLEVYLRWEDEQRVRIIRDRPALTSHLDAWQDDGKLGLVVLIEGGDSITTPEALPEWWASGVRIIGPAWSATRYCGGTRRPGGLTPLGRELVTAMREQGFVLDASHLAEESFWEALDLGPGKIIASHSNARTLVPGGTIITGDRQLSDDMIGAIAKSDGVIGINLFNGFLDPRWEAALMGRLVTTVFAGAAPGGAVASTVTLDAVRAHAEHIAGIAGWERVGIGSDLDGGLGADETPAELDTAADLRLVADVVPADHRPAVLGGNWLRFLEDALPAQT
jgi:membrane dipeptidase